MTPRVAVIVPLLGRPQLIRPLLQSLEESTPYGAWCCVFVCSADDEASWREQQALYREICAWKIGALSDEQVVWQPRTPDGEIDFTPTAGTRWHTTVVNWPGGSPGDYARKINWTLGHRAVRPSPLVFTGASDLRFHPGWLEACEAQLEPGIGVVGTNDLGHRGTKSGLHSTHSLVTRAYIDKRGGTFEREPGTLLCEEYPHEYVDNELVEVARRRGAYAHAADAHVEHLHPLWGKAPTDPMYERMRDRMKTGRRIYTHRAERP